MEKALKIKEKLSKLPDVPGVYLMKDAGGNILYAGKTISLKKRLGSYFRSKTHELKTAALISNVSDFEVIPVASEAEALVLENMLIKKYKPKYNVDLKDGKSYPYVKITAEKFPSVQVTREPRNDRASYLGPFTDAGLLRDTLRFIRKYYPVRNCRKDLNSKSSCPCMQFYIKKCAGPCAGKISARDYGRLVSGIKAFFGGNYGSFEKELRKWLRESVKKLDFEEADVLKKRLFMLEQMRKSFPARKENELANYGQTNVLVKLAVLLNLDKTPYHIEGFDVSNTSGTFSTASKVLFRGGVPEKSGYRKYRVFFEKGIDDYAMIEEVIFRRFSSSRDKVIPCLLLIDGGAGHRNVAAKALKGMGLDIPVISLSKENEAIHVSFKREPIFLSAHAPELRLLQRIRDEAHRFALSYHRRLKAKNVRESFFDGIEGIGDKRKRVLMESFSDIKSISEKDMVLMKQVGVPEGVASEIVRRAKIYSQEK